MNCSQKFKTKFDINELPGIINGYKKQIQTILDQFSNLPASKKEKIMQNIDEISNLSEDLGMNIIVERFSLDKRKIEVEQGTISKELGQFLKQMRRRKGLSRRELSAMLGISIYCLERHESLIGKKIHPVELSIIGEALLETDEEWKKLNELAGSDIESLRDKK